MKTAAAILFFFAVTAGVAQAPKASTFSVGTGREFLAVCGQIGPDESKASDYQQMTDVTCAGYFTGVLNGIYATLAIRKESLSTAGICLSPESTNRDLLNSTVHYIHSDPAFLEVKTGLLVYRSLLATYPCR